MNIKTMKFIDAFLGIPICLLLTIYNKIKHLICGSNRTIKDSEINKIILIKFFGMGSIILSTPMIRRLKQKYPNAKIYFLTFAGNEEICNLIEFIDEVYGIRTKSFTLLCCDLLSIIHKLRSKHCDVVIDM